MLAFYGNCSAQTKVATGTPEVYIVTLNGLQVSSDGGATWTTVNDQSLTFDIASVTAGATVGNYASTSLPAGAYNRVRPTLSATFTMRGYVNYAGNTYFTTAAGVSNVAGTETDTDNMPGYANMDIIIPGYTAGQNLSTADVPAMNVSMTIVQGTSQQVTIKFDVTNKLALYDDLDLYPDTPVVTATMQ